MSELADQDRGVILGHLESFALRNSEFLSAAVETHTNLSVANSASNPGSSARRSWPSEADERTVALREEIVRHIGDNGGEGSISSTLRYLEARGAGELDRGYLTTTMNRMCKAPKSSTVVLLRSIAGKRGHFGLTATGHERYNELKA